MIELLPLFMFGALLLLIVAGFPVALCLIVLAFLFAYPVFGDIAPLQLYNFVDQVAANYALSAVPMFILMGSILERSGIAERLFEVTQRWMHRVRGGMALATIVMCAVFAAGTGVVGAVEVMVGLMAIPPMMKRGYPHSLISGTICAGGSLGTMIPPSLVIVIYGSFTNTSVGKLFLAVLVPGIVMVALFLAYITLRAQFSSWQDDVDEADEGLGWGRGLVRDTLVAALPVLAVMVSVLGAILMGLASVTEAASLGVAVVLILSAAYGRLSVKMLGSALLATVQLSSMILLIVIGGTMFTSIFVLHGGGQMVADMVGLGGNGTMATVLVLLAIVFFLGSLLDWISILIICLPVFNPIIQAAGIDPVWFGILVVIVIQTSYLTPPMAPAIFYLRAIAPKDITFPQMYRGVLPFILAQIATLAVVLTFPRIVTWVH